MKAKIHLFLIIIEFNYDSETTNHHRSELSKDT